MFLTLNFYPILIVFRGKLSEEKEGMMASVLMETRIKVKPNKECELETVRLVDFNDESMICGYEHHTDACQVSKSSTQKLYKSSSLCSFREILVVHSLSKRIPIVMLCSVLYLLAMVAEELFLEFMVKLQKVLLRTGSMSTWSKVKVMSALIQINKQH